MTNRWFEEYMFRLVIDNKYVPTDMMKQYEQKPTMLTPEDPLFAEDE
jgi:bleomycin hydrolase